MKIKLYRSSTVGIDTGKLKILKDPWLTDGEYYGSWSHYPPYDLNKNLNEINSYNLIYISHIHPDHCSEDTLKKINKNIPIYIHNYHTKFLKYKIEKIGFKVIELDNAKKEKLNETTTINIIAADNCDPKLCYKFSGCADFNAKGKSQQIDTLCIIQNDNEVLVNTNDCPFDLAKSTFGTIKKHYKNIDILLTGYGGAGPYPQCFENLNNDQKIKAGNKKKKEFLNQAIKYIENFKPKYYLPFAGTYTLTGYLSDLQELRGVPNVDEAYEYLENYFKNKIDTKAIKINCDEYFDTQTNKGSKKYDKLNINKYKNYINSVLKKRKIFYEDMPVPSEEEIFDLAKKSYIRFVDKMKINNVMLKSDIFIKFLEKYIHIPKDISEIQIIKNLQKKNLKKYVIYDVDSRLLKMLLMGPKFAHWNNAEIGSHIKFFRYPDIYEREIYSSMNYFHA